MPVMPRHGDLFYAKLEKNGCLQGGTRPAIIVQNNIGNEFSPTVAVVPMTSKIKSRYIPTHVVVAASKANGLRQDSMALVEQTTTINKNQLCERIGSLEKQDILNLHKAIETQFSLA